MTDQALVSRILARDKKALYEVYHLLLPRLKKLVSVKISDHKDAEEVLQDTFFAFLESLRDYHGEAALTTYATAICQHKIIDYYRKRKLKQVVFSQFPALEELVSPIMTPEESLDRKAIKEKIQSVLCRLTPRYKAVLLLKYQEGESVDTIASFLKTSYKTVESVLFRARRAFMLEYQSTE